MGRKQRFVQRRFGTVVATFAIAIGIAMSAQAGTARPGQIEEGRVLYVRFCAACHGLNADGHGPVARVLEIPPANLRLLGTRYGDPLPEAKVEDFIDGRAAVAAHGDREMPVWGERFNDIRAEGVERDRAVKNRLAKIIAYLQSIQDRSRR